MANGNGNGAVPAQSSETVLLIGVLGLGALGALYLATRHPGGGGGGAGGHLSISGQGITAPAGQIIGLPITVRNVGSITLTGVVVTAQIAGGAAAFDPTVYYAIDNGIAVVFLPNPMPPGASWSGDVLMHGLAPGSVSITLQTQAQNAPGVSLASAHAVATFT